MNLYLMTPHIIKESSEGTTYCPVQDELFTNRRSIEVVGEINRELNIIPLGSHQFPASEPPGNFFLESHLRHKI